MLTAAACRCLGARRPGTVVIMSGWRRAAAAAGAGLVLAVVTGITVRLYPALAAFQPLGVYVVAWAAFGAGAWLVLGVSPRRAVPVILLGGILIQLAAITAPSFGSDDLYRYIWDGRVQAAGIDPYRYVPAAPQLERLRDPFLWPADGTYCVGPRLPSGCTVINRPRVPTIYPPVAEAYFTTVSELAPPSVRGSLPIQAAGALCAIATSFLLVGGLRRLGRDPRLAVLWAWCPVTALQAGNGAHVDVLAAFLTVAALLTLARPGGRRRALGGGVLLGLAIATKVTPVLAVPAVLRRRPVTVAAAIIGATVAVYVPHLVAVASKVIGFLPVYLTQGGYGTGSQFELISLAVPGRWATLAAVAILAGTGVAVLRRADPDRPWRGAVVMTGVALAVTTPSLLWYPMLLVVLVAMDGRAEWLALAAARYLTPLHPLDSELGLTQHWAGQLGYGAALIVVAAVSLWRRYRSGQQGELRDDLVDLAPAASAAGPRSRAGALAGRFPGRLLDLAPVLLPVGRFVVRPVAVGLLQPGGPVDSLPDDVGVPGVPVGLRGHVDQDRVQRHRVGRRRPPGNVPGGVQRQGADRGVRVRPDPLVQPGNELP
jgi:Glycosyltransferase family 87